MIHAKKLPLKLQQCMELKKKRDEFTQSVHGLQQGTCIIRSHVVGCYSSSSSNEAVMARTFGSGSTKQDKVVHFFSVIYCLFCITYANFGLLHCFTTFLSWSGRRACRAVVASAGFVLCELRGFWCGATLVSRFWLNSSGSMDKFRSRLR